MWGMSIYKQNGEKEYECKSNQKRILYSLKLYKLVYQVMECNKIKERGFY